MSNLKRIRVEKGLSQSQLAEKSGVSVRMIQHYEQGQKDINKAQAISLYELAMALECTMEELIEKPKPFMILKRLEKIQRVDGMKF